MSDPFLLFEDDHLLVVNKPAGLNTHSPAPFSGEGIYDWLRHREPRWGNLAIIHRLDKETSGLIVFSKSAIGNTSLTQQFTDRMVRKQYLLLTDRPVPDAPFTVRSTIGRAGDRYVSGPPQAGASAETRFALKERPASGLALVSAEPVTGRTHQIRVHAADRGFPILGDTLYGGTSWSRICLHSARLSFRHPQSAEPLTFQVAPEFSAPRSRALRRALIDPELTDAFRLIHGAADDYPGWYLDRFADQLLSISERQGRPPEDATPLLENLRQGLPCHGVYRKHLARQPGGLDSATASPQLFLGTPAPDEMVVQENGVKFAIRFTEGASVGLFLDQRDNRRRLLTNHVAAGFPLFPNGAVGAQVLNVFAYTCAFSVCAARAGATTTSLDLSRKYLDWGRRNFRLNDLNPAKHDFIYGDAFEWLKRLAKKQHTFDLILLDPPTFSRSKQYGTFRAERDYPKLVERAAALIKAGGVLFASTNAAEWNPEAFLRALADGLRAGGRHVAEQHYFPQPPDFPVTRNEPAYLKTVWVRLT